VEMMKKRTIENRDLYNISGTDKIIMSVDEFPFKTVFTFKYLIDHWRNTAKQEGSVSNSQLDLLEERLAQRPEWLEPIEDL